MYRTRFFRLFATLFLVLFSRVSYADVFFFGDSLSDSGNFFNLTGAPPFPYFNGRFSNGPTWAENYAAQVGMNAIASSSLGGTNYAYAFAPTNGPSAVPGVLNLVDQVNAYIANGSPGTANDSFFIWSGANDIFNAAVDANPGNVIAAALFNISSSIATLHANGANNIVVLNSVPIGQTPFYQALGTPAINGLNQLSESFNFGLSQQVIPALEINLGIDILEIDIYSLLLDIQADPGSFGLVNASGSVTPFDPMTALASGLPTGDPNTFLFWDGIHPTAVGHQLIANRVYAATIPEPSAVALLAIFGVAFCCRRKRSTARQA